MRNPFLFFFLVACGSPSTITASSKSTAADAEPPAQETASANVGDAAAAPAPAPAAEPRDPPSSCACPDVVVHCQGGGPMYAKTDRGACTFAFAPAMCAVLGLVDGATVKPEALLAATPPERMRADDVYEFCAAKHEAAHACDDATVSSCASEGKAYGITVACMKELMPSVCDADPADCFRLSIYMDASRAAGDLNDCLCAGDRCAACSASCVAAHPEVTSTCERAAAAYCASP